MQLARSTKLIIAIIGLLALVQLFVSSRLSAIGQDLSSLESRFEALTQNNEILEQKIASSSSLLTIRTEAQRLGLRKPAEVLFVDDAFYVVQK